MPNHRGNNVANFGDREMRSQMFHSKRLNDFRGNAAAPATSHTAKEIAVSVQSLVNTQGTEYVGLQEVNDHEENEQGWLHCRRDDMNSLLVFIQVCGRFAVITNNEYTSEHPVYVPFTRRSV